MNEIKMFNPEHDMALANGDKHFIAPKNIREMAHDLTPLMEFIEDDGILVWGWDHAIKERLLRIGIDANMLPTDVALAALRTCSERQSAHHLLRAFHADHPDGPYIGESILARSLDDVAAYASQHGHIILKDPLSSSGKGLRHVKEHQETHLNPPCEGGLEAPRCQHHLPYREGWGGSISSWTNALIRRHGYLTAEPYYDKVQDFAMEFFVLDGECCFIGYSFFNTNAHGRYESNLLMDDERIETLLTQYIPHSALHEVRDWVISHCDHIIPAEWNTTRHPLYFGIDMMVVNSQFSILNSQFRIHPCVEINLRLNMGIIAHEVHRKLLAPGVEGRFHVAAFPTQEAAQHFHREHTEKYPPVYREGKMMSGYHPLTPLYPHTRHHAYIICG